MSEIYQKSVNTEPFLIADHPALDMLNTVVHLNGTTMDLWRSNEDVEKWMIRLGFWSEKGVHFPGNALLKSAKELREIVRTLVESRKQNKLPDLTSMNRFLQKVNSHPELVIDSSNTLQLYRRYNERTAEGYLAPIADSAAELLCSGDFSLIKTCEYADCVLWFYDRTKSHKRRWCSMQICGNRHKVAEFRKRTQKN
jgi:predicted RNA-binding Zn ribbon-like protein